MKDGSDLRLPPSLRWRRGKIADLQNTLFPDEARAVEGAIAARRFEFTAGRVVARALLEEYGVTDFPLLRRATGEAAWPAGIVGSISHTATEVLVAVARVDALVSLGCDIETGSEMDAELFEDLFTPNELMMIAAGESAERIPLATRMFSLKEAAQKCLFPLLGRLPGFKELDVSGSTANPFKVQVLTSASREIAVASKIEAGSLSVADAVCSFAWISVR